jgi:hypothetical protein
MTIRYEFPAETVGGKIAHMVTPEYPGIQLG